MCDMSMLRILQHRKKVLRMHKRVTIMLGLVYRTAMDCHGMEQMQQSENTSLSGHKQ